MLIHPGIGLMSTISYHGKDLETNFRRGVGNDQWCDAANPIDNTGYSDAALQTAIGQFNGNGSVGLIVTVGGVTAARAAKQYATKPFISLFGGTTAEFPGTIRDNFYGGVFLDTVNHNDDRVQHLNGLGHQSAHICLLINPDSKLASVEKPKWQTAAGAARGKIFEARDLQGIAAAFAEFSRTDTTPRLTAMVVSSDPFFQENKDYLIGLANKSKKRVCYPFQTYENTGGQQPRPHHHTLYGPDLATAYYTLGQKAATVINSGQPSTLVPVGDAQENHDK